MGYIRYVSLVGISLWCASMLMSRPLLLLDSSDFHYLVTINIVLGVLFLIVGFIEVFGLFAAMKVGLGNVWDLASSFGS